jgi:DNA repair protein SbcC/Rad50
MQLRHLRVKNIRSYRSGALDLGPGTTLIAGDVGAGKTSLLYAIEMALFGTSEVDAAYLVRHGAPHAEVAVTFEDADHRHEIARKFRRVRRKGRETFEPEGISFSTDGAKTEYSATELRQRVIELLGFPDNPNPTAHSDLWRWAVYVPQERMREILAAKPQERLETVRKALGVERYRIAADNADDLAADLRRSARERRSGADLLRHFDEEFATASREADRFRVERVAIEQSIDMREATVRAARREVESVDGLVRAAAGDARELESVRREQETDSSTRAARVRSREERVIAIAAHRRTAEESRRAAEEGAARKVEFRACEDAIRERRARLDGLATELRQLAAARADFEAAERRRLPAESAQRRAVADRDAARSALEAVVAAGPTHEPPAPTPDSLETIDARLFDLRERERTSLTAVTRARTSAGEWEELLRAGVCPRCGQPVRPAEFEPHREEADRARMTAEAELETVVRDRARAEEERRSRERYERALERWNQVERERDHARVVLRAAETAVATADAALAEIGASVAAARASLEAGAPQEAEDRRLRAGLAPLEAERTRLAAEVEQSAQAAEKERASLATAATLEAELPRMDEETQGIDRRIAERSGRIEALAAKVREAAPLAERLGEVQARLREKEEELEVDRRALVRTDTQLDQAVRRVAESERGRAERARRVAEAEDLDAKAAWLASPFRVAVLSMEQKILAHAQVMFERNFARYFAALIDDPALVARTDVAFTPAVAIEGEWTPAEALSGGERTSLALAFRLALAQVVRSLGSLRLDTVLLDEPTDGFSPEQVVRMGELLDTLSLPQVVLVSHEDALGAIADRVVRVRKTDGLSTLEVGGRAAEDPGPEAGTP